MLEYLDYVSIWQARIGIALGVLLVSCVIGALTTLIGRVNPVPFLWALVDICVGAIGDKLNNYQGRSVADLFLRGGALMIALLFVIGGVFSVSAQIWPYPLWLFDFIWLSCAIALGGVPVCLWGRARGHDAYGAVVSLLSRSNGADMDDFAINRHAIGGAALHIRDALFAPLLVYIALGIEVAVIVSIFLALTWRFGRVRGGRAFMMVPLFVSFIFGFIPSLIGNMVVTVASLFVSGASPRFCLILPRCTYREGGGMKQIFAKALGVTLGGSYPALSGGTVKEKWIGPDGGTAQIEGNVLKITSMLIMVVYLLVVFALSGIYIALA